MIDRATLTADQLAQLDSVLGDKLEQCFSIGRCEQCKWWEKTNIGGVPDGYRECDSVKFSEELAPDDKQDGLVYSYFERGSFYTGPRFGCVHWEQKP